MEEHMDRAQLAADLQPHGGEAGRDHDEAERRRERGAARQGRSDEQPRARAAEDEIAGGARIPVLLDPGPRAEARLRAAHFLSHR